VRIRVKAVVDKVINDNKIISKARSVLYEMQMHIAGQVTNEVRFAYFNYILIIFFQSFFYNKFHYPFKTLVFLKGIVSRKFAMLLLVPLER
jgi:hypothetical protein